MSYKYNLILKFKTGDLFSKVREVEDSVNSFMSDCGFSEKMFLQSELPMLELTVPRLLTAEEKQSIIQAANQSLEGKKMECTGIELAG